MAATNLSRNYKKLDLDTNKRHFVFGDIHGRYETFMNLLAEINYDPASDVIYSVGDLIDRGTNSVEVVEFFKLPGCHAIRGNHEQMVINPRVWKDTWMFKPNGGPATVESLEKNGKSLAWLAGFCWGLPVVLDVGDDDTGFRLVHAEYPRNLNNDALMNILTTVDSMEVGESDFLWGRSDITQIIQNIKAMRPGGANIHYTENRTNRTVFSGHTPIPNVIKVKKNYWIDTARGKKLSCVEVISRNRFDTPMVG